MEDAQLANKPFKRFSKSFLTREVQIKIVLMYHYILTRMVIAGVGQLHRIRTANGGIVESFDLAVPLLGAHRLHRNTHTCTLKDASKMLIAVLFVLMLNK